MSDFQFNIAKGRASELALLGAANDAWIAVVLNFTGLESDAVLKDYDNLAVILAAANDEHSTMTRQTMAVTTTVDDVHDVKDIDATDLLWPLASGSRAGKLLLCYDYDTTGGSDSSVLPVIGLDFDVILNGGNVTYQFPPSDAGGGAGFLRVS